MANIERTAELCPDPSGPQPCTNRDWFDSYTRAAHRTTRLPKGWIGYLFQAVEGQGVMVTGRVVTQAITRGPRKGAPNFRTADPKTELKVFVTYRAVEAQRKRETAGDARG